MTTLARHHLVITDDLGNIVNGATVEVRRALVPFDLPSLFSDRDGLAALGNPFIATDGADAGFHVVGGVYKITATAGAFARTWRYVAIGLAAESDGFAASTVLNDSSVPGASVTGALETLAGILVAKTYDIERIERLARHGAAFTLT
jgi:hypothetical protein